MDVTAEQLRRRVAGWRRAELREHAVRRRIGPLPPGQALDAALDLCELLPAHPGESDQTRAREIARARSAWRTLRTRLAAR